MVGKVLILALVVVAVSAEWKWQEDPVAVECHKKVHADGLKDNKKPCMIVCVGHENKFINNDNSVDPEHMKEWINHLDIEQAKKDSLLKSFPSCLEAGKGIKEDCHAGAAIIKCMKDHGGHIPTFSV